MNFKKGDRVRIGSADRPDREDEREAYLAQSRGNEGVVIKPANEGWFIVKWDHGYEDWYPTYLLEKAGSAEMTPPDMELDEILLAQEMVNGV